MAMRWYVIHVYSGFEKKVAQSIREQAEQKGLAEQFERDPGADRRGRRGQARREGQRRAQVLPGLRPDQDGSDRRDLAPRARTRAKVTGFLGGRGTPVADHRGRGLADHAARSRRASSGRSRRSPSRSASRCGSATVRSPRSTASSRKSTRRRRGSRSRCRSSAARRRSSWNTRRSRSSEDANPFDVGFNRSGRPARAATAQPPESEGKCHGKEDRRLHQAAGAGRQGQSVAADRAGAGSARPEHHGVLQGVQRGRRRAWSPACRSRW